MQDTEKVKVAIVYLVAGISSRFGGKVKQLAEVGADGTTIIEISMQRAINAGFDEIVFIVGEKTEKLFKDSFGAEYRGVPVLYAKQNFNIAERDRPWGTTDALITAREVLTSSFVVCNGDDLYGEKPFRAAREFLQSNTAPWECVTIGYELGRVMPEQGKINRGIFEVDEKGYVTHLTEMFDIEKSDLVSRGLTEKNLCSMTLFGLKEEVIGLLEQKVDEFKENHEGDRKAECLLPVELSSLLNEGKITLACIRTDDKWMGITNPGDDEEVKKALQEEMGSMIS